MKYILKQFLKYLIRDCNECVTSELLSHIEYAIHGNIEDEEIYIKYIFNSFCRKVEKRLNYLENKEC